MTPAKTDYLIIGAGAAGMSFADVMLSKSSATMVLADRRHAPGGHWIDAYPFARLHMPSTCYGVDSTPLGGWGTDPEGDPTLFERATAAEICAYYDRVLHQRLLVSGRVRFLPGTEHLGGGKLRSILTGRESQIEHGRLVDATCTEGHIPATSPPPFEVADGACCISIGELPKLDRTHAAFVIIGAGKTGQDACLWLLERGVPAAKIHWVRPRDPWLQTRLTAQPGPGLPATIDLYSRGIEAGAEATSLDDLFLRLEAARVLVRIDPETVPSTYQGAIISDWQISQLRRIKNVIRRGHIHRIEPERIIFDQGPMPVPPGTVHIHCAAPGLGSVAARPVFDGNRINVQNLRYGLLPLSAGIAAFVEARGGDDAAKNALCQPLVYTGRTTDWLVQRLADLDNGARWRTAPDLQEWIGGTRLSITAGLQHIRDQPLVAEAMERLSRSGKAAADNLRGMLAEAS